MRKRAKAVFIHILPVLLGVLITVYLSGMVYRQMLIREEQASWEQLDSVAFSVSEKISIRFQDNINLMERVADAIRLNHGAQAQEDILLYLESVQDSTIFERIDILFPDNTILHQSGQLHRIDEAAISYKDALIKGSHYSPRIQDKETRREVIYCVVPIVTDNEVEGLLVGVVDCLGLSRIIRTYSFDGTTKVLLIDQTDGSYLMDNSQSQLSSIYSAGAYTALEGFEALDHRQEILNGATGRTAFYSGSNERATYVSYTPVEGFPWSLAVAAQEDQVLKNVQELSVVLNRIAFFEMLLLLSYLLWNLFVANVLVKQDESVQEMRLEKATNEAKSIFLSSVSHDIRTPLNGILGMLDVIDKRRDDPQQLEESLKKIRVSAQYLVSLADNVLDLNDLESGKGQLVVDHIDLRKLGAELDVIVHSRLKDSTVSYHMEYIRLEHPFILGSDGYLHRILTNLIGNAIKYNKENGSICVTVEELEPGNGSSLYRFCVKDTGIGMSEEFQQSMFKAFAQEQSGARSSHTGHGLGLAIVERMVKKMGGEIQVESQKGIGSTFTVTLPFPWDPEGRDWSGKEPLQPAANLSGARILLAEDNELNMEIAGILLGDTGAEITPVINGRLALEAFAASEDGYYDAVLMDIMMPEMDGCEAASAIRGLKRKDAKKVPIIAMTASTFSEDIKRCRESGMNEHVGKPLDMSAVVAIVSKYRSEYRKGAL